LQGFLDRCLMPVSLRREPLTEPDAERVRAWRRYFLGTGTPPATPSDATVEQPSGELPGFVDTEWLAENLGRSDVKIIDCRTHADYTAAHVPGSVYLMLESFRGVVGGVPSMLLPGKLLAQQLSLMGITPADMVVLVPGDAVRDATIIGMGLERVGHKRWAILNGGFAKWATEERPLDTSLPNVAVTDYPAPASSDDFTVDYKAVRERLNDGRTVILDTRPAEFFSGEKSNEARPGHIPGAVNRPYSEDLAEDGTLKPSTDLDVAYRALISTKHTPVIVHCRTGHQASQTYFVLRHLLGYTNVKWYDAGWTDWAARPELPAVQ
jgi:thiosulfate/3-mercaptopyruvate sulfurtransferase